MVTAKLDFSVRTQEQLKQIVQASVSLLFTQLNYLKRLLPMTRLLYRNTITYKVIIPSLYQITKQISINNIQMTSAKYRPAEAALHRCSQEKKFWKYAADLQENTHAEVREPLEGCFWTSISAIEKMKDERPVQLNQQGLKVNKSKTEEYTIKRANCGNCWRDCKLLGSLLDTQNVIKRRKVLAINTANKLKHLFLNKV